MFNIYITIGYLGFHLQDYCNNFVIPHNVWWKLTSAILALTVKTKPELMTAYFTLNVLLFHPIFKKYIVKSILH